MRTAATEAAATKAAAGRSASTGRRSVFWERVRAVARPLAVYHLFLACMFGAFSLAVMVKDPDPDGVMALGIFAAITWLGVLSGQAAALLRLRDWLLYALWGFFWSFGLMFGVFATATAGPAGILVFAFVVLYPMFVVGGAWSLRAGKALFGAWVPLMYATGTAIIVAESNGRVDDWKAGDKWAVWDVFTLSVLAAAVLLFLVYLVSRESHRLSLWRRGPRAPLMGSVAESGAARPRLSCMGWAAVVVLALLLTVGTALLAPYLWRTGPGGDSGGDGDPVADDGGSGGAGQPQPGDHAGEGRPDPGEPGDHANPGLKKRWQEAAGDKLQEAGEALRPEVSQALDLLSTLLIALVLFALALLSFWRPVRRLILARHFERPFLPLSPTARIRNGWRLVEIAIGDAGVEPRENEPAASLVRRARPALDRISAGGVEVHGLAEAAEIRDRVEYGLGVHADDVALMERTARWTYHTVWDRLGEWVKIKRMYRAI